MRTQHVADIGDLRQALRFGVTTVLDMGASTGPEKVVFAIRSQANLATDVADLRSAGDPPLPLARTEELGTDKATVSSVDDATRFVATRREAGRRLPEDLAGWCSECDAGHAQPRSDER
jgi:hypothetical protein